MYFNFRGIMLLSIFAAIGFIAVAVELPIALAWIYRHIQLVVR